MKFMLKQWLLQQATLGHTITIHKHPLDALLPEITNQHTNSELISPENCKSLNKSTDPVPSSPATSSPAPSKPAKTGKPKNNIKHPSAVRPSKFANRLTLKKLISNKRQGLFNKGKSSQRTSITQLY
jgi:hypothetical protein